MVTAALAILHAGRDTASILEVLTFAGGAVFGITVVEAFVYLASQHRLEEESTEVRLLGSVFSFLSIVLPSQPCSPSTGCLTGSLHGLLLAFSPHWPRFVCSGLN